MKFPFTPQVQFVRDNDGLHRIINIPTYGNRFRDEKTAKLYLKHNVPDDDILVNVTEIRIDEAWSIA